MEYHPEFELPAITAGDVSMTRILAKADTAIIELKMDVSEYLLLNELIWGWTPVSSPYHLSILANKIDLITPGAKYWLREASGNNPDTMLAFLRMSEQEQMIQIADVLSSLHHQQYFANVKTWLEGEHKETKKKKSSDSRSGSSDWTTGNHDTSYISHAAASSHGGCGHSSSSDSGSTCSFD